VLNTDGQGINANLGTALLKAVPLGMRRKLGKDQLVMLFYKGFCLATRSLWRSVTPDRCAAPPVVSGITKLAHPRRPPIFRAR
jgi:hypothetical protein